MPVAQCVQILKRQCRVIKTVQAMYSEAVSDSAINSLSQLTLFLPKKFFNHFTQGQRTASSKFCYEHVQCNNFTAECHSACLIIIDTLSIS